MTLATDYALGGVTAYLALRLFNLRAAERSRRWWSIAFAALALGAFLGGTWHGFLPNSFLWKATVVSVGVASFAMVVGSAFATLSARVRSAVIALAAAGLAAYCGWVLFDDRFMIVVIDTAVAFAVVAALHVLRFNGWILAGVAVSVAAALVQASGLALHRHFNHNDLYHVIQIAAMLLLYRGALRLRDS